MKLVVGLGNPGRQYVGTRHNIGFDLIDRLAAKLWSADFDRQAKSRFDGLVVDGSAGMERIMLLKPATFMNLSGQSVQAAMAFYRLEPINMLVVLDDLALPVGRLRLRAGGSPGGHNGLRDIERAIGTADYPRLRIGIDPAPPPVAGKDYVLGKFSPDQLARLGPILEKAGDAIVTWAEKGIEPAMSRYNGEEK